MEVGQESTSAGRTRDSGMRVNEAIWVKSILSELSPESVSPLVELGSSTEEFRTIEQPHIERYIHAPLRDSGVRVITTDLKSGPGIDISGNIYDQDVRSKIKQLGAKSLLCCNILEHVTDRPRFALICDEILAPGGYLVVTVPHSYPYHLDPIDTMFRPNVDEVKELFPNYTHISGSVFTDSTYGQDLLAEHGWRGLPVFFAKAVLKGIFFVGGLDRWKARNHRFMWLFRRYKTVGVLLRKPESVPESSERLASATR
jgi:hypothetical protein